MGRTGFNGSWASRADRCRRLKKSFQDLDSMTTPGILLAEVSLLALSQEDEFCNPGVACPADCVFNDWKEPPPR